MTQSTGGRISVTPEIKPIGSLRVREQQAVGENTRTQQHFKDESDINRIVNRFTDTGVITHLARTQGDYGAAGGQSFTEAMFIVATATSEFSNLPAKTRQHFNNDPAEFLDAAHDPERRDEFVDLGLIDALPDPIQKPGSPDERSVEGSSISPDLETTD